MPWGLSALLSEIKELSGIRVTFPGHSSRLRRNGVWIRLTRAAEFMNTLCKLGLTLFFFFILGDQLMSSSGHVQVANDELLVRRRPTYIMLTEMTGQEREGRREMWRAICYASAPWLILIF